MEFCYPEGKTRALTFSYDDGEIHDRRLVKIFDSYGMHATFHLNSGWLNTEGYITSEELLELYKNHEVACHGVEHRYLRQLNDIGILREIEDDRKALESYTGNIVNGLSYAFGEYSDKIINICQNLGIVYGRTAFTTKKFRIPDDFMRWNPTCHHEEDIFTLLDSFMNPPEYRKMALMYMYGHSFEFARNDNWDRIERFCELAAGDKETWYATNMEIFKYIDAIRSTVFSIDGHIIYNDSSIAIWLIDSGEIRKLNPGETLQLR